MSEVIMSVTFGAPVVAALVGLRICAARNRRVHLGGNR